MGDQTLSTRANRFLELENPAIQKLEDYWKNPWSKDNPTGHINLSTADNNLCRDLILKKLNTADFAHPYNTNDVFRYPKPGGMPSTLEAFAKFITKYFGAEFEIQPDNLCTMQGATCGFDAVSFIVSDPDEAFLCPSPYYLRIPTDFGERSQTKIIGVSTIDQNEDGKFELSAEAVARTYEKATAEGIKVRGILIVNPNNPLGSVTRPETILKVLEYAKSQKLVVLMNEIYGLSVFDKTSGFRSILSYYSKLPDPDRTIWLWGMSKDFCMPGLRFAVAHTKNPTILTALRRLDYFHSNSVVIQYPISKLISDYEWVDNYFEINRKRLAETFEYTSKALTEMGIPHTRCRAGFFTSIDLRKFLKEQTFEGEQQLELLLNSNGLFLVAGESQGCEQPGWFRFIYTQQREILDAGLQRLDTILKGIK